MKIAISAAGPKLDDMVHTLFGRCDCFLIVDSESLDTTAIRNTFADAATGAGTACAQLLFDEGVHILISGQVGPLAHEVLSQGGVEIFRSPAGMTAREAVEKHRTGLLTKMIIRKF